MKAGGRDTGSVAYCGVVRRASSCPVFQYEVRDFRQEAGAWNMVVWFISDLQLAGSVTFVREKEPTV